MLTGVAAAAHGHEGHGVATVLMRDNCEPASFNQAVGPHTCVGNGTTTFQQFISQLQTLKDAPEWRFDPSALSLPVGARIVAPNVGGEVHTFTEVKAFGGGCVDVLNMILGLTPVPECSNPGLFAATAAAPGGSVQTGPLAAGTHLFECLIHPWMRATVTVG
jgi:plastocyanin